MKNTIFAAAATAVAALSITLAAPAAADGWDSTPIAPGNPRGTQPQATRSSFTGAPADQVPAASPGANPYVPLGPGH